MDIRHLPSCCRGAYSAFPDPSAGI